MISRRSLLKVVAVTGVLTTLGYSPQSWAKENKIVIVGGGAAGVIVARYLKKLIPKLKITLVEKNKIYQPAYYSGEILSGSNSIDQVSFSYDLLKKAGISVLHNTVVEINAPAKKITLDDGKALEYDRLVMATGTALDFKSITNLSNENLHAWTAGDQAVALSQQIKAMKQGGVVVISIPSGDISGPLAPYERVSFIARFLSVNNAKAKIVLINGQKKTEATQIVQQAWNELYPGMIDVYQGSEVKEFTKTSVNIGDGEISGDVFNLIPQNTAGSLLQQAGLTDESLWCPVQMGTFESTQHKSIHVIGDAIKTTMGLNKTAQSANAQAKICAVALSQLIKGKNPFEGLPLLTDSEYCILGENYGFSQTRIYRIDAQGNLNIVSEGGSDPADPEKQKIREALYALSWKNNISREMFG